jgi:hypothetical protein
MLSTLLLAIPFILQAGAPPKTALSAPPPINMGLWEATITTGLGTTMKTRSCLTAESYQQQLARLPPGCSMSHVSRTPSSISGDVSCTLQAGLSSSGHFDAQFPNASTARTAIHITTSMEGHSMPMTIMVDSHFVGADCGTIAPGQTETMR